MQLKMQQQQQPVAARRFGSVMGLPALPRARVESLRREEHTLMPITSHHELL